MFIITIIWQNYIICSYNFHTFFSFSFLHIYWLLFYIYLYAILFRKSIKRSASSAISANSIATHTHIVSFTHVPFPHSLPTYLLNNLQSERPMGPTVNRRKAFNFFLYFYKNCELLCFSLLLHPHLLKDVAMSFFSLTFISYWNFI